MTDIASLALRVDALEVNQATEAIKRLERSGGEAEGTLSATTKGIEAGFKKVAAAAAIVYGAFQTAAGASREFLAFDKSLALISTQLGNATEQTKEFEAASRTLATQFGTKLTDQSAAFYEILSAGITDTTKATNLLTEANKLAIGGNARLEVAIDGLTSIIKGYGDKVTDVTQISDALFTAALAGKTTIEELADGLGRVVPIAENLNVSFDELSGSVAALTLSGISTREAITGVRAILASVIKPSSEAADEAERLGLQFDSAAIKSKGFAAFLEDVKQKTGGSSDSLALLFGGVESLIPALALTGNAGVEFNKIMEQMANKTGVAQESFEKMNSSQQAKIDKFFASINSIAKTLGGTLASVLAPAAEAAAKALNTLFNSTQLTGIEKQKKLIEDLTSKIERMRGINDVVPIDNFFYNKKDFDILEDQLEQAKAGLLDLQSVKEELAKPVALPPDADKLVPNDPPKGGSGGGGRSRSSGAKSEKQQAVSESERFLESLRAEAREAGITGVALTELRARQLGVADAAAPLVQKIREQNDAMTAQKDLAAQNSRDMERVKAILQETATAEDVFIAKQTELNRLLSKGMLTPDQFFKGLEKAGDDMNKTLDGGNEKFRQLEFAVQGWGRQATDTLVDFAISGKASFGDFAESVLKDILRMYVQMQLITPLLQSLPGLRFGTSSGSTASTNAAAGVFGNLFKGGRASGGTVAAKSMYEVNERGIPELLQVGSKQFLLTGNQGGNVTPTQRSNNPTGGSSKGVTVNLIEAPGKGGSTKQRETQNGLEIDVMVDQLMARKQVQRGSSTNKNLRQNFGLTDNLVMR